jgi:hypothetical protein
MLRDIEKAVDCHDTLAHGLRLWQWNIFGYWHFGQEDNRYNVYSLREDRLSIPGADMCSWRPHLSLVSSGCFRVEPTMIRGPLPPMVLRHLIKFDRRECEPLMRQLSAAEPWRPAPVEAKPPLLKHSGRGGWRNQPFVS